jgi:hypothetical protein
MFCSDPFLTFLKSHGNNVVRLPQTDLILLRVLPRKAKDLDRLGELTILLECGNNIRWSVFCVYNRFHEYTS